MNKYQEILKKSNLQSDIDDDSVEEEFHNDKDDTSSIYSGCSQKTVFSKDLLKSISFPKNLKAPAKAYTGTANTVAKGSSKRKNQEDANNERKGKKSRNSSKF